MVTAIASAGTHILIALATTAVMSRFCSKAAGRKNEDIPEP